MISQQELRQGPSRYLANRYRETLYMEKSYEPSEEVRLKYRFIPETAIVSAFGMSKKDFYDACRRSGEGILEAVVTPGHSMTARPLEIRLKAAYRGKEIRLAEPKKHCVFHLSNNIDWSRVDWAADREHPDRQMDFGEGFNCHVNAYPMLVRTIRTEMGTTAPYTPSEEVIQKYRLIPDAFFLQNFGLDKGVFYDRCCRAGSGILEKIVGNGEGIATRPVAVRGADGSDMHAILKVTSGIDWDKVDWKQTGGSPDETLPLPQGVTADIRCEKMPVPPTVGQDTVVGYQTVATPERFRSISRFEIPQGSRLYYDLQVFGCSTEACQRNRGKGVIEYMDGDNIDRLDFSPKELYIVFRNPYSSEYIMTMDLVSLKKTLDSILSKKRDSFSEDCIERMANGESFSTTDGQIGIFNPFTAEVQTFEKDLRRESARRYSAANSQSQTQIRVMGQGTGTGQSMGH